MTNRFIVFPVFFAITGTLLFCASYAESMIVVYPGVFFRHISVLSEVLSFIYPYSFAVGAFIGLLLAMWDLLRNKREQGAATRLFTNFFWCLIYAGALMVANALSYVLAAKFVPSLVNADSWLATVALLSFFLLNFTALFWAAIRSITTNDVLAPRVLRAKLRERMRLG